DDKTPYKPTAKKIHIQTYKFGIHPYLNSKKMYISYRPILDLLESKIEGVKFELETSATYAEYETKLYREDFDISLPNPFQTYNALSQAYKVVARMKPDDVFRGIFVARKDSHLKDVSQLKGKSISFPAPTALAATMMPLYYLYENGIDVKQDITQKYVGSQYSSILNALSGYTVAGATWPPPWEAWKKENPDQAQEMEVVWQTDSLINNGVIVKKSLDAKVVEKVVAILVNLDKSPEGKTLLTNAGFEGFTPSNDSDYNGVSYFLKKYEKAIGVPK
ncbi:MAG: phosphate/phosphite/phosphonate ABC transporter substrate-binding protein, partial [Sulfurimonas sp.]|nr:phosphate/phosphite/phosphonate ABC transporter substrate-binding protein [Sulfurimonas sp.]